MNVLLKAMDMLSVACLYLAAAAGAAMAAFVALSSVMRYFVGSPFRFTEELVGLLFAAMVFLTLPYCTIRSRHIRVTTIRDILPKRARLVSDLASAAFMIGFAIIFGTLAYKFAALSYRLKSETDMSGLILYPWMGLMSLGVGLLGLIVLLRLIGALTKPQALDEAGEKTSSI